MIANTEVGFRVQGLENPTKRPCRCLLQHSDVRSCAVLPPAVTRWCCNQLLHAVCAWRAKHCLFMVGPKHCLLILASSSLTCSCPWLHLLACVSAAHQGAVGTDPISPVSSMITPA
jgi:hypothetical protein